MESAPSSFKGQIVSNNQQFFLFLSCLEIFFCFVCMYDYIAIAISDAKVTGAVAKPPEGPHSQRSTRDVPKAPTSQSTPLSSDGPAPTTPAKGK